MPGNKILVVDDDKKVTEGVGAFLKALGNEMILALDGQQAMDLIEKEKPVLVLLDIQLPKINGIEILSTLRKKYKNIKVFIITAYSKDVKWRCDEIGYDEFFEKPIELDPLLEAIKEVVTKKKKEEVEEEPLKGTPKAKILFIEPNMNIYCYTCGMFASKEFNPGEYETRLAYSVQDALQLFGHNTIYDFYPDIVVLYDFNIDFADIDKLVDYILSISAKPKKVIIHGILPRPDMEITQLKKKGVVYCNQNVLTDEDFRQMNKRLIDTIARECIKLDLIKK